MKLEVTVEELRKYSIMVGVPMYGGNCTGVFARSTTDLAKLAAMYGIEVNFFYLFNESLIQRARNYIVDAFLRSKHTHLMFIDADIGFNAGDVLSLLGIQVSFPDKYHVIAAPYTKKTIAWEKISQAVKKNITETPFELNKFGADFVFNPVQGTKSFKLDDTVEVMETGTGFMMIPRETFEKYAKEYPELSYKPDHLRTEDFDGSKEVHAYFDCVIDPETRRYLSEDYFFCQNVRKMGYSVHICPWMKLNHVGTYTYIGDMSALAILGASPTTSKESNPKHYKKKRTGIRK